MKYNWAKLRTIDELVQIAGQNHHNPFKTMGLINEVYNGTWRTQDPAPKVCINNSQLCLVKPQNGNGCAWSTLQ